MPPATPTAPTGIPISKTTVVQTRLMMPMDANPSGNVHGGTIMKYADEIAGLVAHRHSRRNVVTARMERMDFTEPVFIGNALILTARLVFTGRTSMSVLVDVEAENLDSGEIVRTGSSALTMIALNERGKPSPISPVVPETEEETAWFNEAKQRYEAERERARARRR